MSEYNKAKDRGGDGRIIRYISKASDGLRDWRSNGPPWFRRMTTTVPNRRATKRELNSLLKGETDPVNAIFPVNKRPIDWWN